MELVHVRDLHLPAVLAQTVIDDHGRTLLRRGVRLTQRLLDLLVAHGVHYLYVTDEPAPAEVSDILKEETRVEAVRALRRVFDDHRFGNAYVLRDVRKAVEGILDDLLSRPDAVHTMTEARTAHGYTVAHSVSVCALSVLIGMSLEYRPDHIRDLAMGALLHDAGKVRIPADILQKPGPLTEAEFAVVREHTTYGFEMLRDSPDLPPAVARVAHEHHERLDGSGYPQGLVGDEIHPYARIVAVADVYDALTTDRPYRRRVPAHEAAAFILRCAGPRFDPTACAALLRRVAVFPPGTQVRLSTGHRAVVASIPSEVPTRPEVYLVTDECGRPLARAGRLSLLRHPEIRIVEAALVPRRRAPQSPRPVG